MCNCIVRFYQLVCNASICIAQIPTDLNNADVLEVPNLSYSLCSGARELARLFHLLAVGGELNGGLFVRSVDARLIDIQCRKS